MADSDAHVYPVGDLIPHETDGSGCVCAPTTEAVFCDDGSIVWLIKHHSIDGREFSEPDYAGPAMTRERSAT